MDLMRISTALAAWCVAAGAALSAGDAAPAAPAVESRPVGDPGKAGSWTAYKWNKAKGTISVSDEFPKDAPAGEGRSGKSLKMDIAFSSGKTFEFFQIFPASPAVVADSNTVVAATCWIKGPASPHYVEFYFTDGEGKDRKASPKPGNLDFSGWRQVRAAVPRTWPQPVNFRGMGLHNYGLADAAKITLHVADVRIEVVRRRKKVYKPLPRVKVPGEPRILSDLNIPGEWKPDAWNKAAGRLAIAEDFPPEVKTPDGQPRTCLQLNLAFGRAFQFYAIVPAGGPRRIPRKVNGVQLWLKGTETPHTVEFHFTDADGKQVKITPKPGTLEFYGWQQVTAMIPKAWPQPLTLRTITFHNFSFREQAEVSIGAARLEVIVDPDAKLTGAGAADRAAAEPTLGLFSGAPNALVTGTDTVTAYVKLFSWDRLDKPLELRHWLTDWSGRAAGRKTEKVRLDGQSVCRVELKLPRYGPYAFEAQLCEPGSDKPLRAARLPLVRPVDVPRLTAEQRARSPIGVNTHFNAPWQAFAKMGIHWARDYCWCWLGFGESAPMATNGVNFAKIFADSQGAGVTVLPCMQGVFRTADRKKYISDGPRIADAYERLSKAFPTIAYWELDNEMDLQFRRDPAGFEDYFRSYIEYIRRANEGLRRAGAGAKVALNGDAGIYYDGTRRLLASAAKDDFAVCNFHYYTGTVPPELSQRDYNTGGADSRGRWTFLDELRRISRLAHANGREAWLTEVGWDVTYGPAVGERLQAIYLARVYLLARDCGVDKVFWFYDRDGKGKQVFSSCGLLDLDGNARPAAAAMAAVSKLTAQAEYAGSVDLGPGLWCLLFRTPEGKWLAAAWSVERDSPLPAPLASADGLDMFGSPLETRKLTGQVAYFLLNTLPPAWQGQRQARWLSPTILNVLAGGSVSVEARLPAGASLTWRHVPEGIRASRGTADGEVTRATVACSPGAATGRYEVTAIAAGDGWRRTWPLTINVAAPLIVSAEPYLPGEAVKLTLCPAGGEAVKVELKASGGAALSRAKLTVPPAGATVTYKAGPKAAGPQQVSAKLASGAGQTVTLRPGVVDVGRVGAIRLDGKLDDWPEATKLPAGIFVTSGPAQQAVTHLGWSPEGLWLATRGQARRLEGGLTRQFWEWSNLELFVDTSGEAHDGWPASSHQFWFIPVIEEGTWRASAGEWKRGDATPATIYDDDRCKTAIAVGADSYVMEMLIPAKALGAQPAEGKAWRAAVATQTRQPNRPNAAAAWPRDKADGILKGSKHWGRVRFVAAAGKAAPKPSRWEKAIQAFEQRDRKDPPPTGEILFVGSSSIRMWDTKKYFPKLKTIQRGFGGSQVADSVEFAGRIVLPYKPRIIVMYAGDNDIAAGKTPQRVLEDFKEFVKIVHDALPQTRIVYIAIKPSTARWKLVGKMREANALIEAFTKTDDRLRYVDIDKPMLDPQGKPRKELFKADGLHLNHEGYLLWSSLVAPHLKMHPAKGEK